MGEVFCHGFASDHFRLLFRGLTIQLMSDAGRVSRLIYEDAGLAVAAAPRGGAVRVANLIYGEDVVVEMPLAHGYADIGRSGSKVSILLRPRLTAQRANFECARMLARLKLRALGAWSAAFEAEVAGHLVAPSSAFRVELDAVGLDVAELARPFAISQTCAALRVVECGAAEGVVVTPERVYAPRGGLPLVNDVVARKLARSSPKSLRKVPINDEPGRVALFRKAS